MVERLKMILRQRSCVRVARTYVMVNPSLPQLNNGSPHPRGKRKTLGTRLNQVRRQFKAPPKVSPLGSKKRAYDAIQLGPYRLR